MLVRSIPIKLKINEIILRTIKLYKQGLQLCVDKAWEMKIRNNIKLHPFVYRDLKNIGLPAQLSVSCIKQACGMVKKSKNKPFIKKTSIRYNAPRSFSFKNNILSISTIEGRVKIPIKIPEYCLKYFNDWNIVESLLTQSKDKHYFTFTFAKKIDTFTSNQHCEVLGIDLGVNKIAVSSDRNFFGKKIKNLRIKRDKQVSQIQSKCTKSSRKKLKKLSGKWRRFMTNENHIISKRLINSLKSGDVIVMEDLSGIRQSARYNKWIHKWAFYQLQSFIEYKALEKGIRIVRINPKYTSKTCSRCNSLNTKRHSGFFECLCCGYHCNADLNASFNIASRYKRFSWADVNQPIVVSDDSILRVPHCEHDVVDELNYKPTTLVVGS